MKSLCSAKKSSSHSPQLENEVEVFQTEESKSPEVDVHLGSLKSNRHKFVQKEAQRYEGRPEKKKGQI